MRLMAVFNVIRIIIIIALCIASVMNYIFIIIDEDAYFENRVVMLLNQIFLLLAIIFLQLLGRF